MPQQIIADHNIHDFFTIKEIAETLGLYQSTYTKLLVTPTFPAENETRFLFLLSLQRFIDEQPTSPPQVKEHPNSPPPTIQNLLTSHQAIPYRKILKNTELPRAVVLAMKLGQVTPNQGIETTLRGILAPVQQILTSSKKTAIQRAITARISTLRESR